MSFFTRLPFCFSNLALFIFLTMVALVLGACEATTVDYSKLNSFQDPRDGQSYQIKEFGDQTWFVDNLNFSTTESFCYEKVEMNCGKDGRFYPFSDAQVVCPQGWKLPNENDWRALEIFFGMEKDRSKEIRIWRSLKKSKELNELFNVQYAGMGEQNGAEFEAKDLVGRFWVEKDGPAGSQFALFRMMMKTTEGIYSDQIPKKKLCCVRCIKEKNKIRN